MLIERGLNSFTDLSKLQLLSLKNNISLSLNRKEPTIGLSLLRIFTTRT